MRWRPLQSPLPLLGKELVELGSQRRTYVVRAVYATALFLLFGYVAWRRVPRSAFAVARLGVGREVFFTLVMLQFAGILLFLPAIMAGAIASERERRTLPLLLLTDLRPLEIAVQKYLAHLVPMLTFLLLMLPPLAICYTYGGMTGLDLFAGVTSLFLACLLVGAVSLTCSAWCRTTLGATVSAYAASAILYLLLGCFGAFIMRPEFEVGPLLVPIVHAAFLVPAALGMASGFVRRRALASPPRRRVATQEGAGREADLPGDHPIAWRERGRRLWGLLQLPWRILLFFEFPVLFAGFLFVLSGDTSAQSRGVLSVFLYLVWGVTAVAAVGLSADAVASERASGTLDVLLTTPLASRAILRQKLSAVRRLALVLLPAFLTLILAQAWGHTRDPARVPYWGRLPASLYLVGAALCVALYLPLVAWFGLWVSLRSRTRARAVVVALVVILAWSFLPPPLLTSLYGTGPDARSWNQVLYLLALMSPSELIGAIERGTLDWFTRWGDVPRWLPLALNLGLHGALLLVFRGLCLRRADRYLGRARPRRVGRPEAVPEGAGA